MALKCLLTIISLSLYSLTSTAQEIADHRVKFSAQNTTLKPITCDKAIRSLHVTIIGNSLSRNNNGTTLLKKSLAKTNCYTTIFVSEKFISEGWLKNTADEKILSKHRDVLILQDHSMSYSLGRKHANETIKKIKDRSKEWTPTNVYVIENWPSLTRKEDYKNIREYYSYIESEFDVNVIRVGEKFTSFLAPEKLYMDDGRHPSPTGSSLYFDIVAGKITHDIFFDTSTQ